MRHPNEIGYAFGGFHRKVVRWRSFLWVFIRIYVLMGIEIVYRLFKCDFNITIK